MATNSLPSSLLSQEDEIQAFLETAFQDAVGIVLEKWEAMNQATHSQPEPSQESRKSQTSLRSISDPISENIDQNEYLTRRAESSVTLFSESDFLPASVNTEAGTIMTLEDLGLDWSMIFPDELCDYSTIAATSKVADMADLV